MFFQPELGWSVLNLLGQSVELGHWASLPKQETRRIGGGSPVAFPMSKSVLSWWKDINYLRSEFCAYLSPMGWPGIYNE